MYEIEFETWDAFSTQRDAWRMPPLMRAEVGSEFALSIILYSHDIRRCGWEQPQRAAQVGRACCLDEASGSYRL